LIFARCQQKTKLQIFFPYYFFKIHVHHFTAKISKRTEQGKKVRKNWIPTGDRAASGSGSIPLADGMDPDPGGPTRRSGSAKLLLSKKHNRYCDLAKYPDKD
jgi:hypothetical protein